MGDFVQKGTAEAVARAVDKEHPSISPPPIVDGLYHSLIENSLGLVCIHDLNGSLSYVNPAAAQILGYGPQYGIGRNLREFLVPAVQHLFGFYLHRIRRKGTASGMMHILTATGEERIWLYRNTLYRLNGGPPVVIGHALDVTELKRTRDSLKKSFRELEELVEQRTADLRFSNNVLRLEVAERKRVEEALRRQALTFQHISDAVVLCDQEGNIFDWNPAAERMFGYSKSEVLGVNIRVLDPPNLSGEISARIAAALAREGRWSGELPYRRRDGGEGFRELTVILVRNEEGNPVATIGVNRDVTDRRHAEQALRDSEELFRLIIENGSDIVVILDRDATVRFISPSVEHVLGYTPEELARRSAFELLDVTDIPKGLRMMNGRLGMRGTDTHREFRCRHKDGSWRVLELVGRPFRDQRGTTHLVLNARDVTERKKVEESLRISEEKYRHLFERNLAGVLHSTVEGTLLQWNHAFEQILGYTTDELHDLSERDLYYDESDRFAYLLALRKHQFVSNYELCFKTKQGHRVWVLANANLVSAPAGTPGEIIGSVIDITERKHLEEQLRHSQKMDAIGRLAGGVAHDFNNLLTVISGYSDIVLDGMSPGDPVSWQIQEIKKAADRASSLTRQLLAFSRRQLIEPSVLDLNNVVAGVHNMLRRVIGEDIELVTVLHGTPGWVRADTGQIEQVLVNLVVNARDAMPGGGKLTIELSLEEMTRSAWATTPAIQPGSYVGLTVSDTGCGMDGETLSRIFEPFFTTKERGKGTGLGLSTVYGIVKQSGGHIDVSSEINRGTTFRIYFPLAAEPVGPEPEAPIFTDDADGNETVLVVEDETLVRRMVRQILERHGYKVLEACDGHEALALLAYQHRSIDLMLTDAVMPQLNGRQLVEQAAPMYPDLKIMYMSGYTDESLHGIPIDRNIAFIAKPFTPEVLARKLRAVLDKVPGAGD